MGGTGVRVIEKRSREKSDGKLLASASSDKTIKLWNVATRQEINLLNGLVEVNSVNFSPNGKWLASGGNSGQVILWNLEILPDLTLEETFDDLLGQGCDWMRGYLENNPNVEESDRRLCDGIPSPALAKIEDETGLARQKQPE